MQDRKQKLEQRLEQLEVEGCGPMTPAQYAQNLAERVAIQSALGMWEEDANY
jgi:hypothetical protein